MVWGQSVRDLAIFVSIYLLLSLPPFLVLNQEILSEIQVEVATIAIVGTAVLVVLSMLFLSREGVDRFTDFLLAPTDITSILVDVAFLAGAISWWLVPEIVLESEIPVELGTILAVIIGCHIPLILVLALLTVVGKSREYPDSR
jgi:hypothetical protein